MRKYPKVSIIILNYNGRKYLRDCLGSIEKNTNYPNYEVIMVDNGSTDDSVEFVRKNFPWVKIIEVRKNKGFAAGNNIGIRHTKSDYVFLLNPDTIVQQGWLSKAIETAESDPTIGIVGAIPVHMDLYKLYKRPSHFNRVEDVSEVAGAAMLIKRELFNKIGLLDEYMFLYWEDTEFCWRANLAGYRVVYDYDAIVYHHVGGISGKNLRWIYEKKKNELYTYLKLLDTPYVFYFTFLAIMRNIGLIIASPRLAIPILKAFFDILRSLKYIIQKRNEFKKIKEKNTKDLINLIKRTRKIQRRDKEYGEVLKSRHVNA